jgi:Tol biopolymer transport system component/DNA-binding winged helix-turn-helix (wHTH) protein
MLETAAPSRSKISFGLFEADVESGELRKSGVRVRIQGQPFRLLALLLEHPGEVVSREKIQERLWGDRTNVDFDHSLGTAVNKLREALGDSAENPLFVETLARVGYRFIAPVRAEAASTMELPEASHAQDSRSLGLAVRPDSLLERSLLPADRKTSSLLRMPIAAALVAGIAVLCALLAFVLLRTSAATPSRISQLTYSGRVMSNLSDIESVSSTASDGTRIYFSQVAEGAPILSQALIASGEISALGVPSEVESPMISSISPDGSELLVRNHLVPESEQALWILPTLGGDARRVANVLTHDATWMPDGQHILYALGHNLYVVKEDGTDNQKFASVPGRAFWLRWSPGGSQLRFTILDSANRRASLWEMSASGGNLHPLLPGWTVPSNECCGSWTADGTRYVFQSTHGGGSNIWELRDRSWLPWTWLPSTGAPRPITNGPLDFAAPSTSREGHGVFFVGSNSRWEVRVFSPASRQFVPLQSNLASKSLVEYSPDGRWVAWLNASDGSLWKSRADGSERLQLMGPPFHIFRMRWSPGDDRLAVMAQRSGSPWKLYLVDAAGGGIQQVMDEERDEADPDWPADASSLVFGRVPDVMGGGKMPRAIYTVDLRTKHVSEVPGSSGLFSPRLSPDGRYIAAIRANQRTLMVFDRSNARWKLLAEHGVGDPVWSHDSRTIFFQDFAEAGKPIYRVAVNDAHALERVASVEDVRSADVLDYRLIGLAPNDMPLVTAQTSVVNLYSMSLDR